MSLYYAGIGSRETPFEILELMKAIAKILANQGIILRSGAAGGADEAFEIGCDQVNGPKDIWLPWNGFNNHKSKNLPSPAHFEKASQFHPIWENLKQGAKRLHARNVGQVWGADLATPVLFVLCWTPDGCEHHRTRSRQTGGTGMAISMASLAGIPVFNLANDDALERLYDLIDPFLRNIFSSVRFPPETQPISLF